MPRQTRMFVASSGKSIPLAKALAKYLGEHLPTCDIREWYDRDRFHASSVTLQGLINQTRECDFATVLLTRDDFAEKAGRREPPKDVSEPPVTPEVGTVQDGLSKQKLQQLFIPRDNTIFELGLFMGHMGPRRCFMVCSLDANSDALPSDLKGVTIIPFEQPEVVAADGDYSTLGSLQVAGAKIVTEVKDSSSYEHPELPLISRAALAELETSTEKDGNLVLEADTIAVVVNSVEPVEGRDPRFADTVLKNMREGAKYEYYYGDFDHNIAPTANLLQKLALADVTSKDVSPEQRVQLMKDNWGKVWPNLQLMRRRLSIHFRRKPPVQFCVHNALSDEYALCYLRYEGEKFAKWATKEKAKAIAEELTSSCTTHEKEKPLSIFHSTVDFRLAEESFLDEAVNQVIRQRRETILELIKDRFPNDLATNQQANLDKIWLEA